jgi:hypothetical protein
LSRLEGVTGPAEGRPLYIAVADEAGLEGLDVGRVKVYIGVSPEDWDGDNAVRGEPCEGEASSIG